MIEDTDALQFNLLSNLTTVIAITTLPLAAGVVVRHRGRDLARTLLRSVELIAETLALPPRIRDSDSVTADYSLRCKRRWRGAGERDLFLFRLENRLSRSRRRGRWHSAQATATSRSLCSSVQNFHGMEVASAVAVLGSCSSAMGCCMWRGGVLPMPSALRC